jgi:DNA-binding HxlR family transcriptional regulator
MDDNTKNLSEYEKVARKCPVTAAMKAIGGKWKILILWNLKNRVMRFSELERALPGITQAMLTQQLRSLEKDGIIHRKVYPVIPPKVEYSLTKLGDRLGDTLAALEVWGKRLLKTKGL